MEIWKDIKNYEGLYQVSNLGFIRSLPNGKRRKEKLLKPHYSQGYPKVSLFKNGKREKRLIHRLVAFAFLGEPLADKVQINHKNKDRTDAALFNLEWVTARENVLHSLYGTSCQKTISVLKIQKLMKKYNITKEEL